MEAQNKGPTQRTLRVRELELQSEVVMSSNSVKQIPHLHRTNSSHAQWVISTQEDRPNHVQQAMSWEVPITSVFTHKEINFNKHLNSNIFLSFL